MTNELMRHLLTDSRTYDLWLINTEPEIKEKFFTELWARSRLRNNRFLSDLEAYWQKNGYLTHRQFSCLIVTLEGKPR